jgi:hypothetical protein
MAYVAKAPDAALREIVLFERHDFKRDPTAGRLHNGSRRLERNRTFFAGCGSLSVDRNTR